MKYICYCQLETFYWAKKLVYLQSRTLKDFRNLIKKTEARKITFSKEVMKEKGIEFSTLPPTSIELSTTLFCFT